MMDDPIRFHGVTPAKAGAHPEVSVRPLRALGKRKMGPGLRRDDVALVEAQ